MLSTESMPSLPCQVNVTKSGNKLGITIPQLNQGYDPTRTVFRIKLANQSGQASFLALTALWITIPTKICTRLNIVYDQRLSILELKRIQSHSRRPFRTHTMYRKGLIETLQSTQGYGRIDYIVSANGKRVARLIEAIECDYNEIAAQIGVDDAATILRQTKVRIGPTPTGNPSKRL